MARSPALARVIAMIAAVAVGGAMSAGARQTDVLVLDHAVVIDGRGGEPLVDGAVVVRASRIEAVGPSAGARFPEGARVLDLGGKAVLPGLADMHVHLLGGWDGRSSDLLGYQRYLDALLYAGVTTVLDLGNVELFILQLRQEIAAGRVRGPRLYCAGPLIDGAKPIWPTFSQPVTSADQIPALVARLERGGADVLKGYIGLEPELLAMLVAEGKKAGLPVFVDRFARNGAVDLLSTGIAAYAHTPVVDLGGDDVRALAASGIRFVTTLSMMESFSRRRLADLSFLDHPLIAHTAPPWFLEELRAEPRREPTGVDRVLGRIDTALANVKRLHDADVPLAAGTDASYPGNWFGEGLHRELELLVEAGLTPLEAISLATTKAAELVGAQEEWGTIAPGLAADLVVVAGRPDRAIGDSRKIEMVIQAGVVLDRESLRYDAATDRGYRVLPP